MPEQQPYYCSVHQTCGRGRCPRCAEARQQREAIKTLEARIADLEAGLLQRDRRLADLEHRINDGQRAHNVLADWTDIVERHLQAMLAELAGGPL